MTAQEIPEGFLRGPPPNATLHKLDFEHTTPPIPSYKGYFAAVVDDFMTEAECKELLRLAEEQTRTQSSDSTLSPPTWERAKVNAGNGKEVMSTITRNSGRIILDSTDIAGRILDRLMPFMRECGIDRMQNKPLVTGLGPAKRGEIFRLSRLNERMRFLRYENGDYFRPHWDGCYVTPDQEEKSLYTVHLYLNGDGEQNMEELEPHIQEAENDNWWFSKWGDVDFGKLGSEKSRRVSPKEPSEKDETLLGGATSFMADMDSRDPVRIFPKTGSILIFQQRNLFHGGDDVFRGVKYTVRTDVMFAKE
ncbi:Prolyl 4-hydroxylase alpha subunit [Penicillium paradoxum]|uniref:Prolyl 4-hydroxylase alpha subunit n=1 Tax=Penicillium paradoxum TaxID=176176 RepID=UPI0025472F4F|nr:Prolyl 4-hydroxylase alpha subunit [Penicillium paradoxum]KAJ5788381.1 Prolyl 4-hydroxylase alpha subunit [Penicillium paradoxum]